MADKLISSLTAATSVASADLLVIETAAGNSRKVTGANVAASMPALHGGLFLISSTTTTSSAASVTFSSIPATYKDLILNVTGRSNDAGSSVVNLVIQINGDTAGNYDAELFSRNGAGGTGDAGGVAQTSLQIGGLPQASVVAGAVGSAEIVLPDYKGTTFHKSAVGTAMLKLSTATSGQNIYVVGGSWRSTAAISSILVKTASGTLTDGTVASLYGRV